MTELEKERFISGYIKKRGTGPLIAPEKAGEEEPHLVAGYKLAHNPVDNYSHTLATVSVMSNGRAYLIHKCYKQECRHDRDNSTHFVEIPLSLVEWWCEIGAITPVSPFCRN